ncbi:BMP family ABC transporter substrate-binding protein [Anaerotruncus massiliensis (ex Liu et al. 2021)]|uniref:BMP family ABC transporter substrate-binding protein n=2 Tax=Anaerotruncus TaxID=244127 RepID=A0A498CQZ4_9FIRM|nr:MULTISPECIES: BMP family ABC transporter substrate-binding protein [Anaerotruncus]MBC3937585.1 BMP family ABC transporter substrate-binding protein [Anaerotruncus massiliensis (ex Togo et al. 2019)]RLL14695.1 BMP family ABC transporter substrate-binding protein [Anaerotruncus massiliensis (ex Liu et al. 2021)]
MKKYFSLFLALALVLMMFAGCGGSPEPAAPTAPAETPADGSTAPAETPAPAGEKLKVANVVNGNLGDKSFFDSCEAGLSQLAADGIIEYKTFELGPTDADQPKWLSTLEELSADGSYDLIVCGTYQMPDYLTQVATNYPDQKYLIYDSAVDLPNVVCVNYKQNDMGYLVGTAAALATSSDLPNMNPEKVIGFVGGENGPVINDFLVGYVQGAQAADPDVKIDTQYVGNFYDTGAAKELANVMIGQNKCDIVWGVAGGAGNGAAEAANELKAWFIGVDSDQEATFSIAQPELAAVTLFSGLKNIGDSIIWVINEQLAGNTHYGETLNLGISEGGVSLATGGNFQTLPDDIKKAVEDATTKITSGEIVVDTAFGDNAADVEAIREGARP